MHGRCYIQQALNSAGKFGGFVKGEGKEGVEEEILGLLVRALVHKLLELAVGINKVVVERYCLIITLHVNAVVHLKLRLCEKLVVHIA